MYIEQSIVEYLKIRLSVLTKTMDSSQFVLSSVYKVDMTFRPNQLEMPFSDKLLVVQTKGGSGACCCFGNCQIDETDFVGLDIREIDTPNHCFQVALLDAGYSQVILSPTYSVKLVGSSYQKAFSRASIATYEVARCAKGMAAKSPRVVVVGSVANIIMELSNLNFDVVATDLDVAVIGKSIGEVVVEDGYAKTLDYVAQSYIALVTGSSISSNTMGDIIRTALQNHTRIVFYSQTGANFANELLALGVDTFLSEQFPFYMFPGDSTVHVYRKTTERYFWKFHGIEW